MASGIQDNTKVVFTLIFADNTTTKYTVNNVVESTVNQSIENIRQQVINFNNNRGGNLSTKLKSKNGFNWIGIKRVQIITANRTYIF